MKKKLKALRLLGKRKSTDPMIPHQTDASVRDQGLEIFRVFKVFYGQFFLGALFRVWF